MNDNLTTRGKILILVPANSALGGIRNYYQTLLPLFKMPVVYIYRGSRTHPFKQNLFIESTRFISDIFKYYCKLRSNEFGLVHLNTSLSIRSVIRDGIYILLAYSLGIRCIVFFRGWSEESASIIEKKYLFAFQRLFQKTTAVITLSRKVSDTMFHWGYDNKIYIETTLVDENLLSDFTLSDRIGRDRTEFVILFLARLQTAKGIYELLDAFSELSMKYSSIRLIIAGSGTEENRLNSLITSDRIFMVGHVEGKKKAEIYANSDVYVLPSYTEGMPNSVLEAMAFGLPIVCTPVGALSEIVVDNENGIVIQDSSSKLIVQAIEKLYNDKTKRDKMSVTNFENSKKYYSSNVVARLENIYQEVMENSQP